MCFGECDLAVNPIKLIRAIFSIAKLTQMEIGWCAHAKSERACKHTLCVAHNENENERNEKIIDGEVMAHR